ncbi:ABC transporter permease [Donghicola mangrovi]
MRALGAKLRRDLWRMKGQALAIGAVIAVGVAMQIMMTGLHLSLSETRDAYYERYRLADVFASATRVPNAVTSDLAGIDGVSRIEPRITGSARIDPADGGLPIAAMTISLPDGRAPAVNDLLITSGRKPDPNRNTEVVVLEAFAIARGLTVGDPLVATLNGTRMTLRIVGTATSPEFLYVTPPGEFVPDDGRYAVLWMPRAALEAAYDLRGGFNQALLTLSRDAKTEAVLDAVDRVLDPYGGTGAYARGDHMSNRFITEEINGLTMSSAVVPPVFLAVAAFLLYIVISRLVQAEREEIGLLKAFGYRNHEVGLHYLEMALAISLGGALAGCALGVVSGRAMIPLYTTYYKFPFLLFRLDAASFLIGLAGSVTVSSVGVLWVMRRIIALTPSEAMRPPTPPDYSRAGGVGRALAQWLDQPSRMVLRRITRQPARMAGAVIGIAAGMSLSLGMLTIFEGFNTALDRSFGQIDRSDATVSLIYPASDSILLELGRIDGVQQAEPVRQVAVVFRNGRATHRGAITGLAAGSDLYRALDGDGHPLTLPERGIVLSSSLAQVLGLQTGDTITLEIREAARPTVSAPVVAIADSLMGTPAYMRIEALNQLLGQRNRIAGAYLQIDPSQEAAVRQRLSNFPMIAGVSLSKDAQQAFARMMDQGAGSVRYVMGFMAFVITFGIIYNTARVAQAERARELASLRVIGFYRSETAFVLLGELGVVVLIALPLGLALGRWMAHGIAAGFSTEIYQVPVVAAPHSMGIATCVVLGAAVASGWLVKRDMDRADIILALKTRE